MDSTGKPQKVCLGVAIDHWIRKLFNLVSHSIPAHSIPDTEDGDYVALLEAYGHKLKQDNPKISVTGELANLTLTGGIAIAL
jgi:hypothetical protein